MRRLMSMLASVLWGITSVLIIFSSYRMSTTVQAFACVLIAMMFLLEGARVE